MGGVEGWRGGGVARFHLPPFMFVSFKSINVGHNSGLGGSPNTNPQPPKNRGKILPGVRESVLPQPYFTDDRT